MLGPVSAAIEIFLWDQPHGGRGARDRLVRALRYPYALLRDALEGQLTMRAMSLVYTTLLSVVPLIALSFSILKAFGVHYQIEPLINNFLAPLGARAGELTSSIIAFVDNVRGVALGSVGLVLLIFTVITMVQKVEESVNYVWQVERNRSLARRFSEYLSLIMFAPVLMIVAISLLGAVSSHGLTQKLLAMQWVGETFLIVGNLLPYALVAGVFTMVYGIVPNTRVRPLAALVGGVTAGVMWASSGALFASFVATSSRYTAIYSTFAVVIVALIWLYISWLILLIGAKISFYFQNPEYLRHGDEPLELNNGLRERLALAVMTRVGADFRLRTPHWRQNDLAAELGLPGRALAPVTRQLASAGLLLLTDDERLMPGRAMDTITVTDILGAVRDQSRSGLAYTQPPMPCVDRLMARIEGAMGEAVSGETLQKIVREIQQAEDEAEPVTDAGVEA